MYIFLFLALIALSGAGFYEYDVLQDKIGNGELKFSKLTERVNKLEDERTKLEDANGKLLKTITDDQNTIAQLTTQVQTAQQDLNAAKAAAPTPVASVPATDAPSAPASPTPSVPPNKLGPIVTRDGKSYQECKLLKVELDGIVVNQSDGIIKIGYNLLPDNLQKRFGFDPKTGPDLSTDQVQSDEQLRLAAEAAGN